MKTRLLLASAALLSLAACGGGEPADGEAADAAVSSATEGTAATTDAPPVADASGAPETPAASATPTPEASATPSASPTPSPSASAARPTPAASATRVAAAPVAPPAGFATCGVCHSVQPGQHMIGPSLAGVFGRRAGTAAGFGSYSPAIRSSNITWNDATLDRYLADPAAVVQGGMMPAPGVDATQRRAIIAYLKTL